MRIVIASSEAVPFSKTGGLGDVAGALPAALAARGHEVTLVLPFHSAAWREDRVGRPERTGVVVDVPMGDRGIAGHLLRTTLADGAVQVVLLEQPAYFARSGLYDGADNCERYAFFSRAVLAACRSLDLKPDVLHANDWQTALVPALLATGARDEPTFAKTAGVLTLHNMAFQGEFPAEAMPLTGLDWRYFNWEQMEFHGRLNLLKGGIVFADEVTTVSPTYAEEIRTPRFGYGLQDVLESRAEHLTGIINGVDVGVWNPRTDPLLDHHYGVDDAAAGKAANKTDLQKLLGLPERGDVPLFGMISRMTDQKGFDLIRDAANELLAEDVQLCFLGTGADEFQTLIRTLGQQHPEKVSATIGFDEALAHRIEAGSDVYLMPSRFEPCGLNQMYSQIYGAVPLVHRVGGLADTVVDLNDATLAKDTASGFVFEHDTADGLLWAFRRAVETFRDRETWAALVRNGMSRDFSWAASAANYEAVYERAIATVAATGKSS